jgi:hypothetical protein
MTRAARSCWIVFLSLAGCDDPPPAATAPAPASQSAASDRTDSFFAKTLTLRLGDGIDLDAGAVTRDPAHADVTFKYVPAQPAGSSLRFNPITKRFDLQLDPKIDRDVPILSAAARVKNFADRPKPGALTTGDAATWSDTGYFGNDGRFFVVQSRGGRHHLLEVVAFEAPSNDRAAWRASFAHAPLDLPLGQPGGQVAPALTGTLTYLDFFRTKQIVDVDLKTGRVTPRLDGQWPRRNPATGDTVYVDPAGAIVAAAADGRPTVTLRRDDQPSRPALSPDGQRVAAVVQRTTAHELSGGIKITSAVTSDVVAVFDRSGKQVAEFANKSDPAWTPDGRLVCTEWARPGLYLSDPTLKTLTRIDPADFQTPAATPAVSPDGATIAFASAGRVWTIAPDGKNLRQVLPDGQHQSAPTFSPDNRWLATIVGRQGVGEWDVHVHVVDLKSGHHFPYRTATGDVCNPAPATTLSWTP